MLKEVKIELTNLCDRYCKHCSSNATYTRDNYIELPSEKVIQILSEVKEMGASSVVFTGGEATLYKDLKKVVEYAKRECKLDVKLYTMCYRTNDNIKLLNELTKLGVDEVIYSTALNLVQRDSVSTYNLDEFINKLSRTINSELSFHHAITNETIGNVKEVCEMVYANTYYKNRGKISLLRYVPHGRGTIDLDLSKEELLQFKDDVLELKEKYHDFIRIGSPFNILGISHSPCIAGEEVMIVGFDGRAYPCDAMKYIDLPGFAGNIYNKSLMEIYNSEYFKCVRNIKFDYNPDCLICNNFAICKSGCLGQKIVRSFSSQDEKTFSWYEVNARRTMVKFPTNTHMRRNGKRGIFGEIGEFVDALKKLERYQIMDPMPHYIEALEKILTTDNSDLRLRCIETINNSISDEAIKTDEYYLTNIKNIIMNEFNVNGLEYINEIEKYVVNKKESYINMMRKIVIDEIGDACWYVAGSLLASYNASFNDVADYLIGDMVLNETKTVTPNILKYCQSLKDPSCLKEQKKKIDWPLMIIDSLGEEKYGHLDFLADDWEILYKIIGGFYGEPSRETVISHSGELLLVLAAASHQVTGFSIADIISQNVEKLRQRHPTGFSLPVAAARIENNKNYVDDEPDGVIKHNKKLIYGKEAKI